VLLNNLSGSIKPGFCALMGPSGAGTPPTALLSFEQPILARPALHNDNIHYMYAGKSSLMNSLAYRLNNVSVEGDRLLNGAPYSMETLKQCAGYVLQDDILSELLTVEETLAYTATLRLPKEWTKAEVAARVDEVITDMGLNHARHTVVGGVTLKGLSGGERKRVSIGLDLLTNPRLIFLDEPTSGLDSATALSICSLLKDLSARRNTTVVATLHQPSAKIFALFTDLILLKAGNVVYHGSPKGAVTFFESHGYPCAAMENPADHVMDVLTELPVEKLLTDEVRAAQVAESMVEGSGLSMEPRAKQSWVRQYSVLVRRNLREARNGWRTLAVQLAVATFMGLVVGGYMFGAGNDLETTTSVSFVSV
jgi:ATP-binding cassette, subfamily G (WHITE), member 2